MSHASSSRRERGRWIAAAAGLLLTATFAGCQPATETTPALKPVRVATPASLGDGGLRYSGSVEPGRQVAVSFKVGGYVGAITQRAGADGRQRPLQPGDSVRRGEALAQLEDTLLSDQVRMAEANVAKASAVEAEAREGFRRTESLFRVESATQASLDRARTHLETTAATVTEAEAQLDQARTQLGYARLVAPWSGVVLQRDIEIGSLVHPGSPAFVIADVTTAKVIFGVPDTALGTVALGDPLGLTTASYPERTFTGTVTAVSPAADPSSRVFQVEVSVPNEEGALRVGMIVSLEVATPGATSAALGLPITALVRAPGDSGRFAVFVVEERDGQTHAALREIEVGPVRGNDVAVLSGLQSTDRIVVTGARSLADGEAIAIIP